MENIMEITVIIITSLLIITGIVAIDYSIRTWIDKVNGSVVLKRWLIWLRVVIPIVAIVMIDLNYSDATDIWGRLTGYSVEISIACYFIVHVHDKLFVYATDCMALVVMLFNISVYFPAVPNYQDFGRLLLSLFGVLLTIFINHLFYSYDVFKIRSRVRFFVIICLYSMSWWSILSLNQTFSGYDLLAQMVASIVNISIILSLDLVFRKKLESLTHEIDADFLTQIGNRKAFEFAFQQLFNKYEKRQHDWYLVMLDIDDFKQINDQFGHIVGDTALRRLSKEVNLQLYDLQLDASFFRIGGEEFAILLTHIDESHLPQIIEQLKTTVGRIDITTNGEQSVKISISIGVAKYQHHDNSAAVLYERADSYLYAAKKDGKNSVNYEGNKLIK